MENNLNMNAPGEPVLPKVDFTAPPPPMAEAAAAAAAAEPQITVEAVSTPTGFTPISEVKVGTPVTATPAPAAAMAPVKPKKPKLAIILTGALGVVIIGLLSSIFILFSKGGGSFLNALGIESIGPLGVIVLSGALILTLLALVSFVSLMIGIFKFMNAKRDDKVAKKKGLIWILAALVLAGVFSVGAYYAFSAVQSLGDSGSSNYIITDPADVTGLSAPVTILFDASRLPIDESKFKIIGYNWDFGDSELATGPTVSHTFKSKPASGIYTVTLKVSYQDASNPNAEIQEQIFTKVISIENEQSFATFKYDPTTGQAPLKVQFDASASEDPDGQIVNFEWDFNEDGIFEAEGVTAEHTFVEAGTFNVALRITDSNGEFSLVTNPVVVKGETAITPKVSLLPADTVLTPGRAYQFDASESSSDEGDLIKYQWNFGDGQTSTGRKVTHTFTNEGIYEVTLALADNAGNERTLAKNYTVSSSPSGLFAKIQSTPAVNSANELRGTAPFRVSFDGGASTGGEIVDFSWDFNGDGAYESKGQIVEHVFTQPGTFSTNLLITSSDDKTALATVKVVVGGTGLQARVSANPVNGIVPLLVNFDASGTIIPQGEDVVVFQWDFGDGSPILREGPIVTHRYTSVGTFTAKVTAITSQNKTSVAQITIFVNSTPLKACYSMSRTIGPVPLTISFNPQCSTGTISQYTWKFGTLGVSNERRSTFTFTDPGEYEVVLEISDSDNNVSSFTDTVVAQ